MFLQIQRPCVFWFFSFCIMFDIPEFLQVIDRELYSWVHENQAQVHNKTKKNLSNNALHSRTEMVRKRKREHYEEEWKTMFRIYGYSLYFCNQVLVSSTGMQSYTNLHKIHLERASVSWKTALLWWELGFSGEHNDKMCLQTPQTQVRQVAKAPENPLISKLIWLNLPFHPFN